mmetsp:Transcript_8319/g.21095  ORF Transcript_8319/g.21095 Transcript_8319/m.21095 type:complete len:217 (+) Transcript_8319:273-923(+)
MRRGGSSRAAAAPPDLGARLDVPPPEPRGAGACHRQAVARARGTAAWQRARQGQRAWARRPAVFASGGRHLSEPGACHPLRPGRRRCRPRLSAWHWCLPAWLSPVAVPGIKRWRRVRRASAVRAVALGGGLARRASLGTFSGVLRRGVPAPPAGPAGLALRLRLPEPRAGRSLWRVRQHGLQIAAAGAPKRRRPSQSQGFEDEPRAFAPDWQCHAG